jgi:nucleoside-diphosphate-sugar epimerase
MSQHIRLLVVGGTGFIGQHVVRRALRLGWEVTCLSLRQQLRIEGARQVVADVGDARALSTALGRASFEYVVWCAGYIDHSDFFKGGLQAIRTRVVGALNLIDVLDRTVLRSYVNVGSADEYGLHPSPQRESQLADPISPYGMANAQVSELLYRLYQSTHFPAITLRKFLVYGPGQFAPRLIPWIVGEVLADRPVSINSPENSRDLVYIDDAVDAIFAALACTRAQGEIINICGGVGVTIGEIIRLVAEIVGHGTLLPASPAILRRENKYLFGDNAKARAVLEWAPSVPLTVGLARMVAWQRESMPTPLPVLAHLKGVAS